MNPEILPQIENKISYTELREAVQALDLHDLIDYQYYIQEKYYEGIELNWPHNPAKELPDWVSSEDFFAKKEEKKEEPKISYTELKNIIQEARAGGLKIDTMQDYYDFAKQKYLVDKIELPVRPHKELPDWISAEDFLGLEK